MLLRHVLPLLLLPFLTLLIADDPSVKDGDHGTARVCQLDLHFFQQQSKMDLLGVPTFAALSRRRLWSKFQQIEVTQRCRLFRRSGQHCGKSSSEHDLVVISDGEQMTSF